MAPSSVLVVGASLGGLSVVEALRREGFTGTITVLGAEKHLPYDRPPLSKRVLVGEWEPAKAQLRTESALGKLEAEFILQDPAIRLDADSRHVETASGKRFQADVVVIATGLEPRRLSGQDQFAGVHVLRTIDESVALRADLLAHSRVVVVGEGVLGMEIAATARTMRREVIVVGPQSAPLLGHLGPLAADRLASFHREKGVELRLGIGVDGFSGTNGRVAGVRLQNGEMLAADLVVVAIGSNPATSWLEGSGLDIANGIVCDSRCKAAEGIYAVGDVACFFHEGLGKRLRLENRSNAVEQAMAVAANIMGKDKPYAPVPFFWTDQYDAKIHIHGFVPPNADVAILEGDAVNGPFVAAYGSEGKIVGVLGWNMMKQARQFRQLVVDGKSWSEIVTS